MIEIFHDPVNHLLVYRTGEPEQVAHYIPQARRINGELIAVPATLHNLQILRVLEYPIIPVMEQDGYDWPIEKGRKPLAHQKLMANFMVTHPHCFNLSDMGTMKTLATLWAADYLMHQYPKGECRALIVAPLSTLKRVWADAIFSNFLGRRTAAILHGTAQQRTTALQQEADFNIINFDGLGVGANTRKKFELAGFSAELRDTAGFRISIVDEASAYRDSRTKRHRVARIVLGPREYVWALTGTPTPNGPTDAYGIAKLVTGARGESFTSFHNRTMMRLSQFKWAPRAGSNEEARRLLSPAIRFDIKDVWDGPALTTQQREIPLTPAQSKAMAELKRHLQITLETGQVTALNEAGARLKFIQLSLGAVYDGNRFVHYVDAAPRLAELRAVLEQAPGKVLCFVGLTSIINLLYRELKEEISCEIVNGETSQRDRNNIFERFQSAQNNLRLLIADPGTMAHGLDLYAATTVVWYGPIDRTELYIQANKRAHRPGQKYPVTVVQLVSNRLEREIFRRLERNENLQGLLLDMIKDGKL